MTPEAIALRSRMATHGRLAKYSGEYLTTNARKAARASLNERLIAANNIDMDAPDADVRLAHARSLYYQQMAQKRWRNK